jgi:hypothetical protein
MSISKRDSCRVLEEGQIRSQGTSWETADLVKVREAKGNEGKGAVF